MLKNIVYLDDDRNDDKLKYDEIWLVEFPAEKSGIIEDHEYNYFNSKYFIVFDIIIVIDVCSYFKK